MDAQAIIGKKRDGFSLNIDEINWFCNGLASGQVSDAQAGAFAMAITINDMNNDELTALTEGMLKSGSTLKWHLPCLLYTSPSPRDGLLSRMPSSA